MSDCPEGIKKSVKLLCEELEKHYPAAFKNKYDSFGIPEEFGSTFEQRMQMGFLIELLKAGVIPDSWSK